MRVRGGGVTSSLRFAPKQYSGKRGRHGKQREWETKCQAPASKTNPCPICGATEDDDRLHCDIRKRPIGHGDEHPLRGLNKTMCGGCNFDSANFMNPAFAGWLEE